MILLIIVWTLTILVAIPYGCLASKLLYFFSREEENSNSITQYFFLGIVSVTIIFSIINFFYPINAIVGVVICLTSVIIYLFQGGKILKTFRKNIKDFLFNLTFFQLILLVLLLTPILIYALSSPYLYDLDLYHLQYMRWISEYKIIPGLGNLHSRFAFNSSFLMLSSIFVNFKSFYIFPFNALISIFVLLEIFKNYKKRSTIVNAISLLIFAIYIYLFGSSLSSTSTDYGTNLLVLYILLYTSDRYSKLNKFNLLYILTLSLFCFTMKLSCAMIVCLPLFLFVKLRKDISWKFIVGGLLVCMLILAPWIARFIILSGYLLYPFDKIDIFHFDWKMPIIDVINEKNSAFWWARNNKLPFKEVMKMSFIEWFPIWCKQLHLFLRMIYSLCLLAPFILIVLLFFKKKTNQFLYVASCIGILGTIYLITTAPDIRFSSAFVLVAAFIPALGIVSQMNNIFKSISQGLILCCIFFFIFLSTHNAKTLLELFNITPEKPNAMLLLHPRDYGNRTRNQVLKSKNIDGLTFFDVETDDRCYDHYIPCTYYLNSNFHLRGNKIEDGFMIREEK